MLLTNCIHERIDTGTHFYYYQDVEDQGQIRKGSVTVIGQNLEPPEAKEPLCDMSLRTTWQVVTINSTRNITEGREEPPP